MPRISTQAQLSSDSQFQTLLGAMTTFHTNLSSTLSGSDENQADQITNIQNGMQQADALGETGRQNWLQSNYSVLGFLSQAALEQTLQAISTNGNGVNDRLQGDQDARNAFMGEGIASGIESGVLGGIPYEPAPPTPQSCESVRDGCITAASYLYWSIFIACEIGTSGTGSIWCILAAALAFQSKAVECNANYKDCVEQRNPSA